jgi:hypothetical protein
MSSSRAANLRAARERRLGFLLRGDYEVPAITMARGIELEALTRIFETLNRTGVRLDAFDLMVAVLYPGGFHLRDEWQQACDENPVLVRMDASGLEILKVIALWQREADRHQNSRPTARRIVGVRQRDVLNIPAEVVAREWSRAVVAYSRALRLLQTSCGITEGDEIPSLGMLLTISYLLDADWDEPAISRWYWRAILAQTYAQGANTQVLSDIDNFGTVRLVQDSVPFEVLREPLRRNKILRLGLRGLFRLHLARDPLTAEVLSGPIVEIPLLPLLNGEVRAIRDESALDVIFASPVSYREMRTLARRGGRANLQSSALASQGIEAYASTVLDARGVRAAREHVIRNWIEERL